MYTETNYNSEYEEMEGTRMWVDKYEMLRSFEHNNLTKQITRDNLDLRETTMKENKLVQGGIK
jgi:hypothetical protein